MNFDYKIPHKCQYTISSITEFLGCGKPAAYLGLWESGGELWLCKKHLDFIRKMEMEVNNEGNREVGKKK